MKWFWIALLALLLAVLAAWAAPWLRDDPGYVMLMIRGVAVETSLVFLVLASVAVLLTAWALIALLRAPWAWWQRRQLRWQRNRLGKGLLALSAGRYLRAERLLAGSGGDPELQVPALVEAARASLAQGENHRAEAYLSQAEELPAGALAVGMFRAERQLAAGEPLLALALLDGLDVRPAQAPLLSLLRLRAFRASGRLGEALAELPQLRKSQLLDSAELRRLEREIEIDVMRIAEDIETLKAAWKHAPKALRARSEVVAAYSRRALELDYPLLAADALEHALEQRWDETLIDIYADLPHSYAPRALRRCETWLAAHSQSPALLLTLAHFCRIEQLWGKAEDYLRASLAHAPCVRAWEELARVREAQGDSSGAISALHNALSIQRREQPELVPLLRRTPNSLHEHEQLPELRDVHGLPRLEQQPR